MQYHEPRVYLSCYQESQYTSKNLVHQLVGRLIEYQKYTAHLRLHNAIL